MILGTHHIRAAALSEFDQIAHLIAEAHAAHGGTAERYDPAAVLLRLNQAWAGGGIILVAEQDGSFLACGALTPSVFARHTWALSLGATRPDMQGRGIGHALVEKRLQLAADNGAGSVLVSSRNAARWKRYGLTAINTNPVTGASLMVINLDWRAS